MIARILAVIVAAGLIKHPVAIALAFLLGWFVDTRLEERKWQRRRASLDSAKLSKLQQAYQLLGVEEFATEAQVKRAYKKLMSQYHPDKVMAKGGSQEEIAMATEYSQRLQEAYQLIRRSREQK